MISVNFRGVHFQLEMTGNLKHSVLFLVPFNVRNPMSISTCLVKFTALILIAESLCSALSANEGLAARIVLIAGDTAQVDKSGHHDYLAGCKCLELLLRQTSGVNPVRINHGWPQEETLLDDASCIVFYTDGGGKQAFLKTPDRIAKIQALVNAGVGIVMIHQAVDFPDDVADQGRSWLGGVYMMGKSGRGHWDSRHVDFPEHPITRGVTAWEINDGWLNAIQFVDRLEGVVPVVWSGKEYIESRAGVDEHIVAWGYERPAGGRSFSFTGLDAHSAWELPGLRQLVVNGILWSANVDVPKSGAPCMISKVQLDQMETPRKMPLRVAPDKTATPKAAVKKTAE